MAGDKEEFFVSLLKTNFIGRNCRLARQFLPDGQGGCFKSRADQKRAVSLIGIPGPL
jgi:hypothetical protein